MRIHDIIFILIHYHAKSSACASILTGRCAPRNNPFYLHLSGNLVLDNLLEGDGVSSKLADALAELLDSHLLLVEGEAELGLVVDESLALNVLGSGGGTVELLGDGVGAVEELLEETGLTLVSNE